MPGSVVRRSWLLPAAAQGFVDVKEEELASKEQDRCVLWSSSLGVAFQILAGDFVPHASLDDETTRTLRPTMHRRTTGGSVGNK